MKIKSIYPLVIIISSLMLSACASNQTGTPMSEQNVAAKQSYQDQIELSGRLSVQYQENDQEQNLHGNFDWQQNNDVISINLSSPLGQIIANITQSPQGASITEANKPTRYAQDIDQLLHQTVGWTMPVNELKIWLQGFKLNQAQEKQAIPSLENQMITTQGWTLRFVTWQQNQGMIFPKRIDLKRETSQLGELKIRIVIDEWKIKP